MADSSIEVPLPQSVEKMLQIICIQQSQPPPDLNARRRLASIGEKASIEILKAISSAKIRTLSGFIMYMTNKCSPAAATPCAQTGFLSPQERCSASVYPPNDATYNSPISSSERASTCRISQQLLFFSKLEFRKAFLILSYLGSRDKLEDVISVDAADEIVRMKDHPMQVFESKIWSDFGQNCCNESDRAKYLDWDSGKTHLYYCYVFPDGSYNFKGPYLDTTRTHLQRALGDENVLIVKFAGEAKDATNLPTNSCNHNEAYKKIAEEGILVGLRRYRFFGDFLVEALNPDVSPLCYQETLAPLLAVSPLSVFKDGGKEEKKKSPTSSAVKCYFVRMESIAPCDEREPYILSNKTVHGARSLFMHVHTVSSMAKYSARLSLILSKTIKLQIDLASVHVERIEDIPCHDDSGCIVRDDEGEPLIHTDGTAFISEDLAMKCPNDFYDAKYIKDENLERLFDLVKFEEKSFEVRTESRIREPPLLMQCRLFYNGCAVKGTLLVNKQLPPRTIQIRRSMIKVEADSGLPNTQSLNSLEVVSISHKPRKATLSKYLIALLSFGGVPKEYFLHLLTNALEDARSVYSNLNAALRVALNHGEMDDDYATMRMIFSGVPLNEPRLQYRLSHLASEERKGLKGGKLPISESFYLMGTADPTGELNNDEVCVILDNGQISGKVLVYRNPGLHFGDIHILNAVYVKSLENVIGNAKYAIFFSTKGQRSVASEIANGDFDGDMYWVSRNPQLLSFFKASKPWKRIYSTPNALNRKPSEFSSEELEHEFFQLFLNRSKQSYNMAVAADSWLAFMDRLLILGDGSADERGCVTETILKLIDIYYDALDASKSGKKVEVPNELKAEMYPHYMERGCTYHSTSVLGQIYDTIQSCQTEKLSIEEIWKLPCYDVEIPDACLKSWRKRYDDYRIEMSKALKSGNDPKSSANEVIKQYKQMLYGAAEFEESARKMEDVFYDALALYHVTYDYAKRTRDVKKCSFAWKVAGHALCKFHIMQRREKPVLVLPSVLRQVFHK